MVEVTSTFIGPLCTVCLIPQPQYASEVPLTSRIQSVCLLSQPHYASKLPLTSRVLSVSSGNLITLPSCLSLQGYCLSPLDSSFHLQVASPFKGTVCLLSTPHCTSKLPLTSRILSVSSGNLITLPSCLSLQGYCLSVSSHNLFSLQVASHFKGTVCLSVSSRFLIAPTSCLSLQVYCLSPRCP